MAKNIRLGSEDGLLLSLELDSSKQRRDPGLIWGRGMLSVNGVPVISSGDEQPIDWTWVDLLEWLACHWASLFLEQSFPFNVPSLHIGYVLNDLEKRWDNMSEVRVEEEEEEALRFLSRHNVANAFKGIYFPGTYLMRHGNLFEVVSAETNQVKQLPLYQVESDLGDIGGALAQIIRDSADKIDNGSRGALAVQKWDERISRLEESAVPVLTGLSLQALSELGAANNNAFWEFDPGEPLIDSELMAAARMTAGAVTLSDQKVLLEHIRRINKNSTPLLDELTLCINEAFDEIGKPHDQGYWAANWLREKMGKDSCDDVKPLEILRHWQVTVEEISLPGADFDALACWGPRHGPAILINQSSENMPSHIHRANSTLAHEICHLLLDRDTVLPVVEVLNGNTPERLEKRARAFAAELLLPREVASAAVLESIALEMTVAKLSKQYEVSESLVCWQVINSTSYDLLKETEQRWLQTYNK